MSLREFKIFFQFVVLISVEMDCMQNFCFTSPFLLFLFNSVLAYFLFLSTEHQFLLLPKTIFMKSSLPKWTGNLLRSFMLTSRLARVSCNHWEKKISSSTENTLETDTCEKWPLPLNKIMESPKSWWKFITHLWCGVPHVRSHIWDVLAMVTENFLLLRFVWRKNKDIWKNVYWGVCKFTLILFYLIMDFL